MAKRQRNHRARHVRAAMCRQPWAIYQPALAEMLELLTVESSQALESRYCTTGTGSRMEIVGGVAVIPITGVLQPKPNSITRYYGGTATSQVEIDFRRAIGDSQVKAIVLLIDSPGGSAMGNEELARTIFAGRGAKPITSFVRGWAASAAYYIASAADRIVASPSSSVGSIGAILYHEDDSSFLEDLGVKITPIFYGQHKADGNPYEPLTERSRKALQNYVNGYGEQFADAVARNRGVTRAKVMNQFGQGLVFLADEAKRIGLIDGIGTFDAVMQQQPADDSGEPSGSDGSDESQQASATPVSSVPHISTSATVDQTAATAVIFSRRSTISMNPRIKAALFAIGLIASLEASDDECKAVLAGYFRGSVPETDEEILAALTTRQTASQQARPAAEGADDNAGQSGIQPAENVQRAHDRELEEARTAARAEERERRTFLETVGQQMGMTAEQINEGINSDEDEQAVILGWHHDLAEREQPMDTGNVRLTGEGADRFAVDAMDALLARSGYEAESEQPSREAQQMQGAPLSFFARRCLELSGQRINQFADPEQIALDALQMGGANVRVFSAAGPAFNRPGDFPNLLSALAGKILDQAVLIATPTYPTWTARLTDLPDFKPKTIIGVGAFDELDEIMDDQKAQPLQLDEEAAGWIEAGRYGNAVGVTPVMVANDDLDAFSQGLTSLAIAHEHTLNRLCIALIAGNVTLLDGNSLFDDTNHGNDVESGSGGVPSTTQANLMRIKHRRQTGIGGKGKVRTPPRIALVPTALEEDALQTFMAFSRLNESKLPVTDATINTFRGSIEPVVEPDLEDYSTAIWYTFADPRIRRVIVHAFQRGYGRGGKRTTWFDPSRETRYVKLEGRFAAAVCGHRGAVRNIGA